MLILQLLRESDLQHADHAEDFEVLSERQNTIWADLNVDKFLLSTKLLYFFQLLRLQFQVFPDAFVLLLLELRSGLAEPVEAVFDLLVVLKVELLLRSLQIDKLGFVIHVNLVDDAGAFN